MLLEVHAGEFSVADDTEGRYGLEGPVGPATVHAWGGMVKTGTIPVAWVSVGKEYVSYHLMGVQGNPRLMATLSAELRARMQGKSCFNFKTVDEALFRELAEVTAESLHGMRKAGYILCALFVAAAACAACALPKLAAPSALLEAPRLVSPQEAAVLTFFPRVIDYEWTPVAGATRYEIEVDCYRCCATDEWCSNVNPPRVPRYESLATRFTGPPFPGDQPGRWRVWAVDANGRAGGKTAWRQFTFAQPRPPGPTPASFRDPATGATVSGPGVAGPRAVYSPTPGYSEGALRDRITGVVFMDATVGVDGRVQGVSVTKSLRADLDERAAAMLRTWRFEPATKDGKPVPAQVTITMSFNLQK
jgi:TonB family protein